MNKERMLQLADKIERSEHFDMCNFYPPEPNVCKTACCVAGHAVMEFGTKQQQAEFMSLSGLLGTTVSDLAAELLDLKYLEADCLFYGNWTEKDLEHITAAEAAAEIRRMVE